MSETLFGDFMTQRRVQWDIFGQVAVRISDGKSIARGSRTVTMDEEWKCTVEAYGEQVRTAPDQAYLPALKAAG